MWRRRAETTFRFPTYLGRSKETLLARYKPPNEDWLLHRCTYVIDFTKFWGVKLGMIAFVQVLYLSYYLTNKKLFLLSNNNLQIVVSVGKLLNEKVENSKKFTTFIYYPSDT